MALKYVPLNGTTVTKHYVLDCPTYCTCPLLKLMGEMLGTFYSYQYDFATTVKTGEQTLIPACSAH